MRGYSSLLGVVVAGVCCISIPSDAHVLGGGIIANSTTVFEPNLGGVSCYRIPSIVQTDRGSLLAFAEARHGSCSDSATHEIAVRRSTDGGLSWSDVGFAAGNSSYFVGNPDAVYLTHSNQVMLVFVKHTASCQGGCGTGNGFVTSADDGKTWSEPQDVSKAWGAASGSLPGPGTALELKSGRILVVSHHGAYQRDYVTYSDDSGKSWTTINQTFPTMDEAQMAQLPNGSVMLNMRHTHAPQLGRAIAVSHDDGLTFGPLEHDAALISPICQASLLTISGRLYFSNPASKTGRDHLTIKRSEDNGASWGRPILIESGASAGYSCLSTLSKTQGGVLFEASDATIRFAPFDL